MENFHEYRSVWEHGELMERLRHIRHVALDMDGTIYMGMSLFPYTQAFLRGLREQGIGYSFLTNNPSKCIDDYLHKLAKLGIEATRDEMYTTALATIDYIKARYPAARRLFLLGTPSMISEFEAAGFESCADSADDVPDVVVAAFDMTLQYDRLCRAAWWVKQGVPYIATNPDRVCPTDLPTVLVDCGSICACMPPDAVRTSRSGNPIPTCSRASSRATDCNRRRSSWSATASTPTYRWPTTPERWVCWSFRARRRSMWRTRPTRSPTSRPTTSRCWANCSAKRTHDYAQRSDKSYR